MSVQLLFISVMLKDVHVGLIEKDFRILNTVILAGDYNINFHFIFID